MTENRSDVLKAGDMAAEAVKAFDAAKAATALVSTAKTPIRFETTKADAKAAWLLAKVKTRAAWLEAMDADPTTEAQAEMRARLINDMGDQFVKCKAGQAAAQEL